MDDWLHDSDAASLFDGDEDAAASAGGWELTTHGDIEWGDGPPRQSGCFAKNAGKTGASELNALKSFKFNALRPDGRARAAMRRREASRE